MAPDQEHDDAFERDWYLLTTDAKLEELAKTEPSAGRELQRRLMDRAGGTVPPEHRAMSSGALK